MNFDLKKPGLIILNQFKTNAHQDNINHYWYISTEGIDYLKNNSGVLSQVTMNTKSLLDLIIQHYKKQFEFAFEKIDLGFFTDWSCLQIQIYSDTKRTNSNNANRFLTNLDLDYSFNDTTKLYEFKNFPEIQTQFHVYELINENISNNLSILFSPENVAHCAINDQDFLIFEKYENKIEFLEKVRFRKKLEMQFELKNKKSMKKI